MSTLNIRRVVSGHDDDGNAIIVSDTVLPGLALDAAAESVLAWSTDVFPSDNTDETDGGRRDIGLVSPGGSALRFVTMSPHTSSPHHRTQSLDYGIVLDGEVELELDGGSSVRLQKGDVVVQRGTIHTWRNSTDQPSTMVFVLLDAAPIQVGSMTLSPA